MNLTRTLLQHRWKAFFRSPAWERQLTASLILGLFAVLAGALLLAAGKNIREVLAELFPGQDPVRSFHGGLLFYWVADLIGRFVLQGMPVATVDPYRHLPIRRATLLNLIMGQVPLSWFNLFPLLVVVPFALTVVLPQFGGGVAAGWLVAFGAVLLFNSYAVFYLRMQAAARPQTVLLALGGLLLLVLLDRYAVVRLSEGSVAAFGVLLVNPGWALVPVAGWLALCYVVRRQLRQRWYAENIPSPRAAVGKLRFPADLRQQRYKTETLLLVNELKLIARHRRPRSNVLSGIALAVVYGFIFFDDDLNTDLNSSALILPGIIVTSSLMVTYGQFLIAWEGSYYDRLLTVDIPVRTYLRSKHRLLLAFCLIIYLLALPLVVLGWSVLIMNTACLLFNVGVSSWVIIYLATHSRERIDLSKSNFANWQGVSGAQWLMALPILFGPLLIGALANWWIPGGGVVLIAGLGLLGLLARGYWLKIATCRFRREKYRMAAGFRQKPT